MKPTIDQIITKVEELAERYPSHVYERPNGINGCFYDKGNSPDPSFPGGCIFGMAFYELGHKLSADTGRIGMVLDLEGIEGSYNQFEWCRVLQTHQDHRHPWGECIKLADEHVQKLSLCPNS